MLLQVTAPNFEISTANGFEVIYDFLQNKIRASELQFFAQNLTLFLFCTQSITVNKITYFMLSQILQTTATESPILKSKENTVIL